MSHEAKLRAALERLVGGSTKERLQGMANTLRPFRGNEDADDAMNAITTLLETMEPENPQTQPAGPWVEGLARNTALLKLKEAEVALQQFAALLPEARRSCFDMDIRNLRTCQGWVKAAVMTDEVTA